MTAFCMPCLGGGGQDDGAGQQQSRAIDRQLLLDEKRMSNEAKLLLLGAGESGKSTILKSMRVIHQLGFAPAEREQFRRLIFANLLDGMHAILNHLDASGGQLEKTEHVALLSVVISFPDIEEGQPFPTSYYEPLRKLWNDAAIRQAYRHANEAAIQENLAYYFADLDRLFHPSYVPTDLDILRCRNKTTGIVETQFTIDHRTYRIFDVGGQRSERRKWIHCFENVTAVFFIVAISGYDCCLTEDRDANQMQESIILFDAIFNSRWFVRTSMILFLNKIDIFRVKISESPVRAYFPDYEGSEGDFIATRNYFRNRFLCLNRQTHPSKKQKEVYPTFTNATDPVNLKVVMASVTDIIITNHLRTTLM